MRPLGASDKENCTNSGKVGKMGDEMVSKYCERLKQVVDSAEADVIKVKALLVAAEINVVKLRAMQSRLKGWVVRLDKHEKQVMTYKGKTFDTGVYIMQSEDVKMDLDEYLTICEETINAMMEKAPKGAKVINGAKIVKTTPSKFPEFDGEVDFDIWETNWKQLANHSGLEDDCLIIKLRESLVGKVREYIGVHGMSTLSYNQTWEKLKERYAVPWVKTQQASRKYFSIQPPTDDDESIVKYIDAVRDAVDSVESAALQPEHILFNIALDNLPERVRVPLAEKLEADCPDFKFSKAIFEKQFSKIMSLLKNNPQHSLSAIYNAQVNETLPVKNDISNNEYGADQLQYHQSRGRGRGGFRGRGRGRGSGHNANQTVPTCTLCAPLKHHRKDCKYKTAKQKRDRLVSLGRCQACATILREHGVDCSHKARCPDHPGQRHLAWTCDGKDTAHPGPQSEVHAQQPDPNS